jgi:hypothetical protein
MLSLLIVGLGGADGEDNHGRQVRNSSLRAMHGVPRQQIAAEVLD